MPPSDSPCLGDSTNALVRDGEATSAPLILGPFAHTSALPMGTDKRASKRGSHYLGTVQADTTQQGSGVMFSIERVECYPLALSCLKSRADAEVSETEKLCQQAFQMTLRSACEIAGDSKGCHTGVHRSARLKMVKGGRKESSREKILDVRKALGFSSK